MGFVVERWGECLDNVNSICYSVKFRYVLCRRYQKISLREFASMAGILLCQHFLHIAYSLNCKKMKEMG